MGVEEASMRHVSVRYWRSKPLKQVRAAIRLYLDKGCYGMRCSWRGGDTGMLGGGEMGARIRDGGLGRCRKSR